MGEALTGAKLPVRWQSHTTGSQTTRTRASGVGRATRPWSGAQVRRPTWHHRASRAALGLAHLPCTRAPLQAVLIQWAAKVAFFKLKLDQLMDSLCRVCLAESKQNLKDKTPNSHGEMSTPPGVLHGGSVRGLTLCHMAVPGSPPSGHWPGPQMSSGALCLPSQLALQGAAQGKFLVSPAEKLGLGQPHQAAATTARPPACPTVLSPGEASQSSLSHKFMNG